jgi:hypothetical protein
MHILWKVGGFFQTYSTVVRWNKKGEITTEWHNMVSKTKEKWKMPLNCWSVVIYSSWEKSLWVPSGIICEGKTVVPGRSYLSMIISSPTTVLCRWGCKTARACCFSRISLWLRCIPGWGEDSATSSLSLYQVLPQMSCALKEFGKVSPYACDYSTPLSTPPTKIPQLDVAWRITFCCSSKKGPLFTFLRLEKNKLMPHFSCIIMHIVRRKRNLLKKNTQVLVVSNGENKGKVAGAIWLL